ncbi:hypothetical protein HDV06_000058 [Boothiomyces sp. JEL0866]|nr:hypothetical protein HDV06_000058 [Boothiomyces sp. JEL0866]
MSHDSDEEDPVMAQRAMDYAKRKAAKPKIVAKSIITLDIKPWDDETEMDALKESVLKVEMEGLLWGSNQIVPIGYGISKLTINCVVVDDLVGTDELSELIIDNCQDYVRSIEIVSFNKI